MPRPRGWVWEHFITRLDNRGRRHTACIYCDSTLAGRGNPLRMTRHLALYCLAVPQIVKERSTEVIQRGGVTSPSSSTTQIDERQDDTEESSAFNAEETKGATMSPIQITQNISSNDHDMDSDCLLLTQYMAPTADELLARALTSSNLPYDSIATPEWYDLFQFLGYELPPKSTIERLHAAQGSDK